jgi:uncharacterized membrane protein
VQRITWPVVALVAVVLAAVDILALNHADTTVILSVLALLGVGVGIGGGAGMLSGIKTSVNGNLSKLVETLAAAMDKLAASSPPSTGDGKGDGF